LESANATITCPWRTANAGRPVEITAVTCELTRNSSEFLVKCYKAGCKGADKPKEKAAKPAAKAPEAAPTVRAEVSKHEQPAEEPKGSPVVGSGLCACGCGQPAKARGRFASRGCRERHCYHQKHPGAKLRRRRVAEPAEPVPAAETIIRSCPGICEGPSAKLRDARCLLTSGQPIPFRLESKGPKPLKAPETLKEDAQRHHLGGRTEKVEPTEAPGARGGLLDLEVYVIEPPAPELPKSCDGLVADLLALQPSLLKQIAMMAEEDLRTLEGQTIWCLREYLSIHTEAVRLAATEAHA